MTKNNLAKARFRAARIEELRSSKDCRPTLISPRRVEYRYAGDQIIFEKGADGQVARIGTTYRYRYLSPEDFAFLFVESGILMKAAEQAVREAQRRKQKKQSQKPTDSRPIQLKLL